MNIEPYEINDYSKLYLIDKDFKDSIRIKKEFKKKKEFDNEVKILDLIKNVDFAPKIYKKDNENKILITDYTPYNLENMLTELNVLKEDWNSNHKENLIDERILIKKLIDILLLLHLKNISHNDFKAKNIRLTSLGGIIIFNSSLAKNDNNENSKIDDINKLKYIILQILYSLPYSKEVYSKKGYNGLVNKLKNRLPKLKNADNLFKLDIYNLQDLYDAFDLLIDKPKNNVVVTRSKVKPPQPQPQPQPQQVKKQVKPLQPQQVKIQQVKPEIKKELEKEMKVDKKSKVSDEKILDIFLKDVKFNNEKECSTRAYSSDFFIKKADLINIINKYPKIVNLLPKNFKSLKKEEICKKIFEIENRTILPTSEVLSEYKDLNEISDMLLDYDRGAPVNFICYNGIQNYLYLHILNKHRKNSCLLDFIVSYEEDNTMIFKDKLTYKIQDLDINIIKKTKKIDLYGFSYSPNSYSFIIYIPLLEKPEIIDRLLKNYEKCSKNKKLLVVPIRRKGHFNMLVFNYELKQLERYEPHGKSTHEDYEEHEKIIEGIAKYFVNNGKTEYTKNFKYISHSKTCPRVPKKLLKKFREHSGLQIFDGTKFQKQQMKKILETTFKDTTGYCCMWSYLYMEYRLYNPLLPENELGTLLLEKFKSDPKYLLRKYIRGYTQELLNDLRDVVKGEEKLFMLLNRPISNYVKDNFTMTKFKDLKDVFDNYLIDLYLKLH
tara:strand:+ start:1330 stop:3486 length:2157 start_codon:yes stop_codon:yes gene_type:complete